MKSEDSGIQPKIDIIDVETNFSSPTIGGDFSHELIEDTLNHQNSQPFLPENHILTIYSISGVEMNGNTLQATINTNSACALVVELYEDTIGIDGSWEQEAVNACLQKEPIARVATQTPDYGEMICVSIFCYSRRLHIPASKPIHISFGVSWRCHRLAFCNFLYLIYIF